MRFKKKLISREIDNRLGFDSVVGFVEVLSFGKSGRIPIENTFSIGLVSVNNLRCDPHCDNPLLRRIEFGHGICWPGASRRQPSGNQKRKHS